MATPRARLRLPPDASEGSVVVLGAWSTDAVLGCWTPAVASDGVAEAGCSQGINRFGPEDSKWEPTHFFEPGNWRLLES